MNLTVFEFFLWGWFLLLIHCGLRRCLIWFWFSWIHWGLFCVISCSLYWKMFHMHLKRMSTLLLWGEMFCIYELRPFDREYHWMPQYLCWFFACKNLSIVENGVLKSPTISVLLSISFLKSYKIFLIYLGAPMLGAYSL